MIWMIDDSKLLVFVPGIVAVQPITQFVYGNGSISFDGFACYQVRYHGQNGRSLTGAADKGRRLG